MHYSEDLTNRCYVLGAAYPLDTGDGFRAQTIVWCLDTLATVHRDEGLESGRRWQDGKEALQFAMERGAEFAARMRRQQAGSTRGRMGARVVIEGARLTP
jgi:hypothetical protein